MKNKIYISKSFLIISAIVIFAVTFSHHAFASDTYTSPANGGVVWSTVDILPSATLSQSANPTFTVSGYMTSASSSSEVVSLTASNNGGPEVPIIPSTLGGTISLASNAQTAISNTTFTTPSAGSYNVLFTTNVDILSLPDYRLIMDCQAFSGGGCYADFTSLDNGQFYHVVAPDTYGDEVVSPGNYQLTDVHANYMAGCPGWPSGPAEVTVTPPIGTVMELGPSPLGQNFIATFECH